MIKLKRIQRKRVKGWKMPPNTVYVGRPSKWGNEFTLDWHTREESLKLYEAELNRILKDPLYHLDITELRGKNLACWCPLDKPCHADILLKLANENQREGND